MICNIRVYIDGQAAFIKEVPSEVLYIGKDKKVLVEYDLKSAPGIRYWSDKKQEFFDKEDIIGKKFMNCRKK